MATQKRRNARRQESDDDKRTKWLQVRVMDDEHAEWVAVARSQRMSLSVWVRYVLNGEARRSSASRPGRK